MRYADAQEAMHGVRDRSIRGGHLSPSWSPYQIRSQACENDEKLAKKYGVSQQAMAIRLSSLGYLSV